MRWLYGAARKFGRACGSPLHLLWVGGFAGNGGVQGRPGPDGLVVGEIGAEQAFEQLTVIGGLSGAGARGQ